MIGKGKFFKIYREKIVEQVVLLFANFFIHQSTRESINLPADLYILSPISLPNYVCNLSKPSICMGVSVNLPILQHPLTLSFFFFWIGIYGRIRFSAFFARIDIYSPKSLLECKPAHPGQLPWLFSVCLWLPLSPFSLLQFTFFGQTSAFCTCVFFG